MLPVLGSKHLRNVTPSDIERVYSKMADNGLSGNTRLHVHRVIHLVLTDAVRLGRIAQNPASRGRLRAPRKERFTIQPPTPKEVARLIKVQVELASGCLDRYRAAVCHRRATNK